MTKEEKIIATAFTGIMFIDGSDMGLLYGYMEKKVGHGVLTLCSQIRASVKSYIKPAKRIS